MAVRARTTTDVAAKSVGRLIRHVKLSGYKNYGCRCFMCRVANAAKATEYRQGLDVINREKRHLQWEKHKEFAIERRKNGASIRAIAKELGLSYGYVYTRVKRAEMEMENDESEDKPAESRATSSDRLPARSAGCGQCDEGWVIGSRGRWQRCPGCP